MWTMSSRALGAGAVFWIATQSAAGQVGTEVDAFAGLGFLGNRTPSSVVTLNDNLFAVVSPTSTPEDSSYSAMILVVSEALNEFTYNFYPIPGNSEQTQGIHHRVYRLDDWHCVLPSSGQDELFGTADDALQVLGDLRYPGLAQVQTRLLGRSLPTFGPQDLMVLGPNQVAWIDLGSERFWANGNESIVVVTDILQGTVVEIAFADTGIDHVIVPMEEGLYGLTLTGPDYVLGTLDDEVAFLAFDPATGLPELERVPVERPIVRSYIGGQWPMWAGGRTLCLADRGTNGILDGIDDVLVFVEAGVQRDQIRFRSLAQHRCWTTIFGPPNAAPFNDAGVALPCAGPDRVFGSLDDQIAIVYDPLRSSLSVETGNLAGNGLATNGLNLQTLQFLPRVHLAGDVFIVATVGKNKKIDSDDELVSVARDSTGTWVGMGAPFYDPIHSITPLGRGSAMVQLYNGSWIWAGELHEPGNASYNFFSPFTTAGGTPLVSVSPTLAVGTLPQPPGLYSLSDHFLVWRTPGQFEYGQAAPSVAGYEMIPGIGLSLPRLGGGMFTITLQDAPPSSFGYFLISTARDSIFLDLNAELLISLEEFSQAIYWFTLPNGSTSIPVFPPTDPALAGVNIHSQWLVYDGASARGFQLSPGLTIGF